MHDQHQNGTDNVDTFTRNIAPRASVRSTSSHAHAHAHHSHNHRRRKRSNNAQTHQHTNGGGTGGGTTGGGTMDRIQNGHQQQHAHHTCTRRHRSVTDISNVSLNTCNDPLCPEREIQEIFVHKTAVQCCSNSRTELAQYFAEDLYGSSSRRPSSCCTSSDYCYQTDSTSLYGSRSSLSRNNSVKSASVTLRKKKPQPRQPSYSSISLRALNASRPNSQMGSLTSIFDRAKQYAANGDSSKQLPHDSPAKVTIERHTSKDALSNDLPEYACSPSPIRWSFLADGKTPVTTDSLEDTRQQQHNGAQPQTDDMRLEHRQEVRPYKRERREEVHTTAKHVTKSYSRSHSRPPLKSRSSSDDRPSTLRKCCESPCKYEESTMVQFHQDAEQFNNCCSNYVQCNTYLDQDLQITSEDIHQYLSKGHQEAGSILNNTKSYPFQPSNALEFQYKNNFANNNTATNTLSSVEGAESMRSYDARFRRNSSKETNLNQNPSTDYGLAAGAGGGVVRGACAMSSCSSTPLTPPANINLSSSSNNINIVFSSSMERNANEVKFINTTSRSGTGVVSTESHHAGYLPYTYPTYDYTNMAANSQFNKPIGIDEIPQDMMNRGDDMVMTSTNTTSSSQHSSSLQSPEPQQGMSFESFDAASGHNLLSSSQRGSCQYSPTTPRSPLSPASPSASSSYSASIIPSSYSQQQHHPHYDYPPGIQRAHTHYHHHGHYGHHHHFRESFKLTNAFKKVRKRARKYTDFLRKK